MISSFINFVNVHPWLQPYSATGLVKDEPLEYIHSCGLLKSDTAADSYKVETVKEYKECKL